MNEIAILCWSAASIGTMHTLMGPDHYIPFVAMSKAGNWSLRKTMLITVGCGIGHVLGSVGLGMLGLLLGSAVFKLETVEAARGDIAAWMMMAFGLAFFVWSVWRAGRGRPHSHWHSHEGGVVHCHEHEHQHEHLHVHATSPRSEMTAWALFVIFLFGPCEPLIPLLMYPAASASWWAVGAVALIFAVATILTMTTVVWIAIRTTNPLGLGSWGRLAQPLAGLMVLGCGLAIKLGL